MKKRIIGLLLVLVMLTMALAGCGYSYAKDDLSKYVSDFDKTAFEAALGSLVIKDGDFTADEAKRAEKVIDHIYELLAKEMDTDAKVTEGVIGEHDKLYYCYYATTTVGEGADAKDITIYASTMKEAAAKSMVFGISDTDGIEKEIEKLLAGVDITDMVYKTKTTGKIEDADKGKVAYISYTLEYNEYEMEGGSVKLDENGDPVISKVHKYTVENERVTVGDTTHPAAKELVGATIGTALSETVTTGSSATYDLKSYTNVKANWVVEGGEEVIFDHLTYAADDKETNVVDEFGTTHKINGCTLTYHVYPVYYLEVEELSADAIMKTLLDAYTEHKEHEEGEEHTEDEDEVVVLPAFEGKEELLDAIVELKEKLATAKKDVETATTAVEKAEDALETAQAAIDANKEGTEPTDAQKDSLKKAEDSLAAAKTALTEKEEALTTAEKNLNDKLLELYKSIGNNDAEAGKERIVEDYKKDVYDELLDAYNVEIKNNLAAAIWELMQDSVTIGDTAEELPKDAIQNAYDRIYESYEYQFQKGTYNSTTGQTNYNKYEGSFQKFLMAKTETDTFENAKHALWADAIEYVVPVVTIYYFADVYEKTATDAEINEYKKDVNSNYSYAEYYYGEENAIIAFQFDKLMDYFLESEESDEGVVTYKNFNIKNYTFETEE